ncbi:hypothetical protein [Tenacibaculum sp. 190524A02b]|uniref:hypothetical protein n=1 Tax=Tenacibaculum vairaonense TaxID=3137860 RepID=UPI0031FA647D
MNDLTDQVKKVLNVTTRAFSLLIISIYSCSSVPKKEADNRIYKGTYTFEKYKSKSRFSRVMVDSYSNTDFKLYASVKLNGLIFLTPQIKGEEILPIEIEPIIGEKYKLEVFYPNMYPIKIKEFQIEKGDSIVIKAYLKEKSSLIQCQ